MLIRKPLEKADELRTQFQMDDRLNLEYRAVLSKLFRKYNISINPAKLRALDLISQSERKPNVEDIRLAFHDNSGLKAEFVKALTELFQEHEIKVKDGLLDGLILAISEEYNPPQPSDDRIPLESDDNPPPGSKKTAWKKK